MSQDFLHTTLGSTGRKVHRVGLSATYWPGKKTIYKAVDEGINFFFAFSIDKNMLKALREIFKTERQKHILTTGAYNLYVGYPNLRRTLEKRLRQFRTDYIDIFMLLGVTKPGHFKEKNLETLNRFKEEGKIKFTGLTTHDRKFAGKLASEGKVDVIMIRYNAAHRGAEKDIFSHLREFNPGIVSYTATRWRYLMKRPKGWPKDGQIPSAGMCYRFVLSNPNVHVCMMAPSNIRHFENNLEEIKKGPLNVDEMEFMKNFGDAVYSNKKWFM